MVKKLTYVIFWSFRKSYQRKNISKCLAGSKKNGNVEWLRFWSIESHTGNYGKALGRIYNLLAGEEVLPISDFQHIVTTVRSVEKV